jgi:predicted nucleotidyltransferase
MGNDEKVKRIIFTLVEKLKKGYQPEKIILYGSYAWGKPTKDSDLDLFIIKRTNERHIDRAIKVCEILDQEEREVPLEPLVYTPEEVEYRLKIGDDFIKKIIEEGKVLYG